MIALLMDLKLIRQKHGLSQEDMAKKLGVSRPTYIQIEQRKKELTLSQYKTLTELGRPALEIKKNDAAFDKNKFKEVLLYILEQVGAKPNIGETALFKLLYFIDFNFFEKTGRSLTGATYMKNHHGPTPRQFKVISDEMIAQGDLEQVKSKYFQYEQRKYLPHRKANLDSLTGTEKEHIDEVLTYLSDKNGSELRSYSHDDFPWFNTEDQKDIDYSLVFQRTYPYAQRDHEMDFLNAAGGDILDVLPPLSEKEYEYYMSLPDKK